MGLRNTTENLSVGTGGFHAYFEATYRDYIKYLKNKRFPSYADKVDEYIVKWSNYFVDKRKKEDKDIESCHEIMLKKSLEKFITNSIRNEF